MSDYKKLVKCIENALEESDGFDVSLPYEVVTKLVEHSESFHEECVKALETKISFCMDMERRLEEKEAAFEKYMKDQHSKLVSDTMRKIDAAGEASFQQVKEVITKAGGLVTEEYVVETDYEHLDIKMRELQSSSSLAEEVNDMIEEYEVKQVK
jgi:hypothetical protein